MRHAEQVNRKYPPERRNRAIRPSDLGFGVTICIGAITSELDVLLVTDAMFTLWGGAYSTDTQSPKFRPIHRDWFAMFSGENVNHAIAVLARVNDTIVESGLEETAFNREQIHKIIREAYQAERRQRATDLLLSPYGLKMEDFLANGHNIFSDSEFSVIQQGIEMSRLECELLICGFYRGFRPHIFSVVDPGIVEDHDGIGFWIIGSGSNLALASLALRKHSPALPTESTVFHVCEAKFAAESAIGIGKTTAAVLMTKQGDDTRVGLLGDDVMSAVRLEYERIHRPQSPTAVLPAIRGWLANRGGWLSHIKEMGLGD
jgi:hypothetical protein